MRALSGFNSNPTAMQFRKNFQHGTITTLLFPPPGANCKPDECMTLLTNYTEVIKNRKNNESDADEKANEINARLQAWAINEYYDEDDVDDNQNESDTNDPSTIVNSIETITLERCSMKYVAGYIINKCLNKFGCMECKETLM